MSLSTTITALDYFLNGFIIASALCFCFLFLFELTLSFLNCLDRHSSVSDEFYQQTKALLNSDNEPLIELESPSIELMSIRELRNHIRSNNLHYKVRASTHGKSVSNTRKHELIAALA
jgi:hypothetical protein